MIVQLVVAGGNRTGQVVPITVEKFVIGRAEDCHLRPRSEMISRYHCVIHVGDDVVVRDLGSKNGVRLNGERVSAEQKIKNGDKLVIGPLEFYVHIASDGRATTLPTEGHAGTAATWLDPLHDDDSAAELTDTILLDHLKSLNPGTIEESEKSVDSILKKFL